MAIEKTVKINVQSNINDTTKEVNSLDDSLQDLNKTAEKTSNTEIDTIGDGAKKSGKGIKGLSGNFKALGLAIKATGIGILVSLLGTLTSVLSENEKVSSFFKTTFEAISIVVNDVVGAIINAVTAANKATGGFDALGKVIGGIITLQLTPLKLLFFGIKLALQQAQLAWEESFFGDKDQNTIKQLNISINETKESLQDVATDALQAGKDVVNNFGEAVGEISTLTEKTVNEISKVDVASSFERAKLNIDLAKSAEIAAAKQGLLIEKYDIQAEKLRQIRDNDLKSLKDREEANNELVEVLDMQEKALLKQADAIIASANAQLKKNNNTQNQIALLEAQANKEGILAQIEGLRSEQESNRVSLQKERLDLNQSVIDSETERELRRKEFAASEEKDILDRLDLERKVLEEQKIIEEERLQNKIDSYEKDTQARVDAENELKDRLLDIDLAIIENKNNIREEEEKRSKKEADDQLKIDKIVADNKKTLLVEGAQAIQGLLKKNSAASKALAAAQVIFDTQQGITSIFAAKSPEAQLTPFPVKLGQAALVGAKGALALRNILKTNPENGLSGGGTTETSGGATETPPAFNLVGASGVNQIQDSLQNEQQPIKAFVVSQDVTTAQELDRNIIESASIG